MSVIYVLMPLALVLGGGAVWAFIRATRAVQFDDLETPAQAQACRAHFRTGVARRGVHSRQTVVAPGTLGRNYEWYLTDLTMCEADAAAQANEAALPW